MTKTYILRVYSKEKKKKKVLAHTQKIELGMYFNATTLQHHCNNYPTFGLLHKRMTWT